MRKLLALVFLLSTLGSFAQPYGNEWIDYSQRYYKFPVTQTGIHRINYADFPQAQGADKSRFQIFGRGKEQYIYVSGSSSTFSSGDYIEFYAQSNDGYLDSLVYLTPDAVTNPFYSLFSDTANYFFCINSSSTNNRRYTVETDQNFSAYDAAPFVWFDAVKHFPVGYNKGPDLGPTGYLEGVTDPDYISGEGWIETTSLFGVGASSTKDINTANVVGGQQAWLRACVVSKTKDSHSLGITYQSTTLVDTSWDGALGAKFSLLLSSSTLSSSVSNFSFTSLSNPGSISTNKKAMSYIWLRFPKTPNGAAAGTFRFLLDNNPSQGKYRVDITNIQGTQATAMMYDLTNHRKIPVGGSGGTFSAVVPNGGQKECVISSEGQVVNVTTFKACGTNNNGSFIDLSSQLSNPKFLIAAHKTLMGEANSYASYRTSKGLPAIAVDVEELYDQFAHGIEQNPLAIRRFAKFGMDKWDSKYLFLIGKSVMTDNSQKFRTDPTVRIQNLVPTWGLPCADNLFMHRVNQIFPDSNIAVGRLAAKTATEVSWYLDKVVDYEMAQQTPEPWMKNVAFLSGGLGNSQASLLSHCINYKNILEDTLFGGIGSIFQSTTSAPINITLSDSIRHLVEGGVSIMTFFGHSSGSGFDVSTDEPYNYHNPNKYPLIVANGCLAGEIHYPEGGGANQSIPWVILQDAGAIGFISQGGYKGLEGYLDIYSYNFFSNLSTEYYSRRLGDIIRHTVYELQNLNNEITKFNILNTTLHGDPAIIINSFSKPDLMISQASVYTSPSDVTTTLDSFNINIVLTNQARAFEDTFNIEIIRTRPDGTQEVPMIYTWQGQFPNNSHFRDTLVVPIPIDLTNSAGINRFKIHIDNVDQIDEITNFNNNLENYEVLVRSPDIFPVYPYKYAIVGNQAIKLKASTGDPFAPSKTYKFQIDTTDLYNSSLLQQTLITSIGGVVTWSPTLLQNMPDSTVYFWRCIPDSTTNPGNYNWRESSFQYISGKHGMGQAHYFQYKDNNYNLLKYNRPNRRWDFSTSGRSLSCQNFSPTPSNLNGVEWRLDGAVEELGFPANQGCSTNDAYTPSMWIAVIDNATLQSWRTYDPATGNYPDHKYGDCFKTTRDMGSFLFRTSSGTASQDSLIRFLNEVVPDSFYILAYTWRWGEQFAWKPELRQAFIDLGFTQIDTLSGSVPWIYFCQKGKPSTGQSEIAATQSDVISFNTDILGSYYLGQMTTPVLGPATEWKSFHYRSNPYESPNSDPDTTSISIIGITPLGAEVELLHVNQNTDILNLNTIINAVQYPTVKLKGYYRDDSLRTPAQMDRWQLLFDGVPECALNPALEFSYSGDSLQQFDTMKLKVAITNIGEYDMDSLRVKYWIEGANHDTSIISNKHYKPLLVGQSLSEYVKVSTALLSGPNKVWVEANPANDQPEQYHFNNIGYKNFYAKGDRINPILDVTFDGVHILNRDIVSAKPNIVIELKDENQYLLLNDTLAGDNSSLFKVLLKEPGAANYRQIFFKGFTQMQFEPATMSKNKCKIIFPATFPTDGIYELIVQAKDKASNSSGQIDYKIEFEVINKSTITEVLNYPNPFTTSTRFVFVLTGSLIPDNFKVQILSITGKVVKEIDHTEIGPLHIGRNISSYSWDGTDTYGDRLANGVYLYRVVHKIGGQDIEHRSTAADEYFKKGWGKMFLMR